MRIYILTIFMLLAGSIAAQKPTISWENNGKAKNVFSYKVEKGDNLSRIAHRFGTTVKAIQKANPQLGKTLSLGAIIRVPIKKILTTSPNQAIVASRNADTTGLKPIIYVVKKGDTYSSIIHTFNINDDTAFDKQNGLQNHNVRIGQKLIVGAEKSSPPSNIMCSHIDEVPPANISATPLRHYRTDTATLDALPLEDCGSDAHYVFTSEYPLGAHLTLYNTVNNKSVSVTVTAEKPELAAYNHVSVLMSCAAARVLDYNNRLKPLKVLISK